MDEKNNAQIPLDELALKDGPLSADEVERFKRLTKLQSRMSDMLIARFRQNIETFRKYIPDIAAQFEHYRPKTPLEFFCTENGIPNLQFPEKNNEILYKCDDPIALCRSQVEDALKKHVFIGTGYKIEHDPYGQIHHRYLRQSVEMVHEAIRDERPYTAMELKSSPNCVVVGIGLGYPLALLCERIEAANLLLIEPDADLFFASLHTFDWASFLDYIRQNQFGIDFLIGQDPEQLNGDLTLFYSHHGRFLTGQCFCFVHYASSETQALVKSLLSDYYRMHAAMGFFDDHLFGISHALYAATHHKKFLSTAVKPSDIIKKTPLFIVGSGPSLDHDIPFLRAHQDEAIIIACGTALDTLYHAGIRPDFYAATERTPEISETLDAIPDKEFLRGITLIAGDVIHPYTQERFAHTAIFGKPDEPFYWMAYSGLKLGPFIRAINIMNPIVGNLGVSAGLNLGFKKICLFGLDNGKRVDSERMHSQYTTTYNEQGVSDKGGNYNVKGGFTLPGNFGGDIAANYIFRLANRHMELVISHFKAGNDDLEVINCSDGALIKGASPCHSEDLKLDGTAIDKGAVMAHIHEGMSYDLKLTRDQCRDLCNPEGFDETVRSLKRVLEHKPSSRVDAVSTLERCCELLFRISEDTRTRGFAFCLDGSTESQFIMILNALYRISDEKKSLALYDRLVNLYLDFLDDAQKLFRMLPDYIMGEHHALLNGKLGFDHPDSKAPDLTPRAALIKKAFDDPLKTFVKRLQ